MAGLAIAQPGVAGMVDLPTPPRIAIVGVGGAGGRIVSRAAISMPVTLGSNINVEYFAADTDPRSLDYAGTGVSRIYLRKPYPYEWGSCIFPAKARKVGWHYREQLADATHGIDLANRKLVVLVAGFGRGAGTGLTQAIAWQSRQVGATTIACLAMPYSWEVHAVELSTEMRRLVRAANTVIKIKQDESRTEESITDFFSRCDKVIASKVCEIIEPS
jgi:cell division GTPase FtsZ